MAVDRTASLLHLPVSLFVCGLFAVVLGITACSLALDLQECDNDDECSQNQRCTSDNLCEEAPTCDDEDDCGDNEVCDDDGICQAEPDCTTDNDCDDANGEICTPAGHCEVLPDQCSQDGDCPGSFRCTQEQYCRAAPEDCQEHEDCFEGYICGQNDQCLDASAQCEIDEDCRAAFGEDGTCDDGLCAGDADLIGGPCQQLYGATGDDDAFLIGVVLQLSGVGAGFGQPMLDAIRIAKRDINSIGGISGIAGSDDTHEIGLVVCDTQGSNARAEEAAEHLTDAGIETILGFNSSQLHDIRSHIVETDTLVMSPSATARTITNLADNGLIWRTAPSDENQAIALAALIEHAATDYLVEDSESVPAGEEPVITVLIRNQDQWAEGLRDGLVSSLPGELTTASRFSTQTFPNVGAGDPAEYTQLAAEMAAETNHPLPDIVIVLGSADSWELIEHIDNAVPNEPLFIGADAMKNLAEASTAPSELEHRIWGTGPRSVAEIGYTPYTIFRLKFERQMNDNADNYQFVANAFDALYTVAFGATARAISGPEIAVGLGRLNAGDEINPSATDAQQAIEILSGSTEATINYVGASGPINFDEHGDPASMPIALWCFEDGQVPERGQLYDPENQEFTALTCDPEAPSIDEENDDGESD